MKLRNKKSGEIVERVDITIREVNVVFNNDETYNSLAELNEEWEDYRPKEPLIKDEKIRKAVRAWAEANEIGCGAVFYDTSEHRLMWLNIVIDFDLPVHDLDNGIRYTIAELCGEEE